MGRIPTHIFGIVLIIISAAVGTSAAHQDGAQAEHKKILKPLIEKDISGLTKALSSLVGKEDRVWYQGDKLHFDLMLEGAKQELQGNYEAAIESYLKALKVQLYEEPNYEAYLPLGRAYIQNGEYSKAILALNMYKEKASYDIQNEYREWTLSPEGKEKIRKKIEICDLLLSLLKSSQ